MAMEEEKDLVFAEASHVRVLETNILHASDVIYWLNGASAEMEANMQRIDVALDIRFSSKPRDAHIVNSLGKTALLRKPQLDIVDGLATDEQKERPLQIPYLISGEVWDLGRRYNPVQFDLSLGAGNGESIVLYPSPTGTAIPSAGALYGTVRDDASQNPVIWGLLELEVTLSGGNTQTYRAQTDGNGDFILSLIRLPPLPDSVTEYGAVLRLTADLSNVANTAPDTSTYVTMELETIVPTDPSIFESNIPLSVIPGEVNRLNSVEKDFIAIRP